MIEPPKKYFRLFPGNEVQAYECLFCDMYRLCDWMMKEMLQRYIVLMTLKQRAAQALQDVRLREQYTGFAKDTAVNAEVRLYENLVDEEKGVYNEDGSINLNPNSLKVLDNCYLEPALADAKCGDRFQFLRQGYFCVDSKDHTSEKPVFNRIVSQKSSYKPVIK